jgi:hypothetical protein
VRRALVVVGAMAAAARLAHAVEAPPEVFDEADAAQAAYVADVKAIFAGRLPELDRTALAGQERTPCVRGGLSVWVAVRADGAIADAWADGASQAAPDATEAVLAKIKTWKWMPPPGRKPRRLLVSLGRIPTPPPAPRFNCDAQLLDRAKYHVTELVPGIESGAWWGACKGPGGDVDVRGVKLKLKRFRSEAGGDDADEKTGREVQVKGCDAPLFLFRGVQNVKEGAVGGAKVTSKDDGWKSTAELALGGAVSRLRIDSLPDKAEPQRRAWKLVLEAGGAAEVLDSGLTDRPPRVAPRWAGDLDGDGRLDLLLEDRNEGTTLRLYLSSSAVPGRQVKQVAETSYGGG